MKHLLLTTIAAVVLATTAFADSLHFICFRDWKLCSERIW